MRLAGQHSADQFGAFPASSANPFGCGSKPMVQFGVGAPPILVYFSGYWNVHWGHGILTHGHLSLAGTDPRQERPIECLPSTDPLPFELRLAVFKAGCVWRSQTVRAYASLGWQRIRRFVDGGAWNLRETAHVRLRGQHWQL